MVINAQQRWYKSCVSRYNQRKEEKLAQMWNMVAIRLGTMFVALIILVEIVIHL